MKNSEKILERLKNLLNIGSDTKLSTYLGISQSTLSSWKQNDTFDIYRIYDKINGVNINWLLTGEGEPYIENVETLKNKIKELEETIKKIDLLDGQDNKSLASLDTEIRELRSKLAYAEELIFKLANR